MSVYEGVKSAHERIESYTRNTPVEFSHFLSEAGNARVFLKTENFQKTGSFKFRGAMNKLLGLDHESRERGVVAASTGNHGAAVACGAATLGCQATIFAPENAVPSKLEAIRIQGGEVRMAGDDCVVAERAAREWARSHGSTYISPYNDPVVLAGQGTIGLELDRQMEQIDAVFVAVGGGGLISGIGGFLKEARPEVQIIGCSPENSCVMHDSLEAGHVLDNPSTATLSDATAGGIESDSVTFPVCQDVIDRFVLVPEDEIRASLRDVIEWEHMLIEGAAAMAVAAYRRVASDYRGHSVAIVLCGASIAPAVLADVLAG